MPGINFPKINIGGGSFSRTKIGKRDKNLNIESSQKDDARESIFKTKYDDYSDFT
jgi:hypothetical protein